MLNVALIEPEIPPNTGNVGRLCLAAGARLHLVKPFGFDLDEKSLRRAGLDYWERVDVAVHESLDAFLAEMGASSRFFLFTTKSDRPYDSIAFEPEDYLLFGRETKGLPESLLRAHPERCATIPTKDDVRSLNLATAAGIVLFEAVRQLRKTGTWR